MPNFIALAHMILADLRTAIARFSWRAPTRTAILALAIARIGRTARRLETLFQRWQSATLPTLRPARPSQPRARAPKPPFPSGRAWLATSTDHHVRGHASQLNHLLAQPDALEFLTAVPRAGRLLRPLCRMLGIEIPTPLRLPPTLRTPRPKPTRPPPPTPSGTPDRPLPANIRAAVRAWRKKPT